VAGSEKRRLSAKQIVADIRSGMDDAELRRKYNLSQGSLDGVYRKLVTAGALSEAEIRAGQAPSPSPDAPQPQQARGFLWHCPACQTGRDSEFDECPACGVVVAKFLSRQAVKESAAGQISETMQYGPGRASIGWSPVVWTVLAALVVGGGLLSWALHRAGNAPHTAAVSTGIAANTVTEVAEPLPSTSGDEPPAEAETTSPAETSEEQQYLPDPVEIPVPKQILPDPAPERPATRETRAPITTEPPRREVSPRETLVPRRTYATGMLRVFTSKEFTQEVVEASKVYPVLFQFYSDT
jgi:hypothetical protein